MARSVLSSWGIDMDLHSKITDSLTFRECRSELDRKGGTSIDNLFPDFTNYWDLTLE